MKKYKCIMFDLDGTVVESLQGILNAANKTFKDFGINVTRTYEQGKTYIGAGAPAFIMRAMKGLDLPKDLQDKIVERFYKYYEITQKTDAKLFDGIKDLIINLKQKGYKVAMATNKPQHLLLPLMDQLFGEVKFDAVLGHKFNNPPKPDPFVVNEILKELNIEPKDCLYVGDSEYDNVTAKNAGIDCLIVRYGYGFYDQNWINDVDYVVDTVSDVVRFLLGDDR